MLAQASIHLRAGSHVATVGPDATLDAGLRQHDIEKMVKIRL